MIPNPAPIFLGARVDGLLIFSPYDAPLEIALAIIGVVRKLSDCSRV
jgi:hypothetical protein